MKAILAVRGRPGLEMVHLILRGNRKFAIMKNENEMRGFILDLKRVTPGRNESLIEVEGVDRFIADVIFIPEDRRGLY